MKVTRLAPILRDTEAIFSPRDEVSPGESASTGQSRQFFQFAV